MIEVYRVNNKKNKEKLHGFIEDKIFFFKKKDEKRRGFIEGNVYYWKHNYPLYSLTNENDIIDLDQTGEKAGYIKDFGIYDLEGGSFWYKFSKENGELINHNEEIILRLKGNLKEVDEITFMGCCFHFLELWC